MKVFVVYIQNLCSCGCDYHPVVDKIFTSKTAAEKYVKDEIEKTKRNASKAWQKRNPDYNPYCIGETEVE